MSAAWYYAKDKERFGPVSLAELRSLVAQGKLRPADLVWTDQLPAWTPAGKVRELFPLRAVDSVPGIKAPAERIVPAPARPIEGTAIGGSGGQHLDGQGTLRRIEG